MNTETLLKIHKDKMKSENTKKSTRLKWKVKHFYKSTRIKWKVKHLKIHQEMLTSEYGICQTRKELHGQVQTFENLLMIGSCSNPQIQIKWNNFSLFCWISYWFQNQTARFKILFLNNTYIWKYLNTANFYWWEVVVPVNNIFDNLLIIV